MYSKTILLSVLVAMTEARWVDTANLPEQKADKSIVSARSKFPSLLSKLLQVVDNLGKLPLLPGHPSAPSSQRQTLVIR